MSNDYKVGNVSISPNDEAFIRENLSPTSVPVNGVDVMDFCKDIVDIAMDLEDLSYASRAALVREIRGKLHGIVFAFLGDTVFKGIYK